MKIEYSRDIFRFNIKRIDNRIRDITPEAKIDREIIRENQII